VKATYLDDKLRIVIRGERSDLRDCAKIILTVTNGSTIGFRNENMVESLFDGKSFILGHYKREKVKIHEDKIMYGFLSKGASKEAEMAAENHYLVIKENIQELACTNGYRINGRNG